MEVEHRAHVELARDVGGVAVQNRGVAVDDAVVVQHHDLADVAGRRRGGGLRENAEAAAKQVDKTGIFGALAGDRGRRQLAT